MGGAKPFAHRTLCFAVRDYIHGRAGTQDSAPAGCVLTEHVAVHDDQLERGVVHAVDLGARERLELGGTRTWVCDGV